GADIIAIDGTDRPRPVPVETLLARIHHHGLLAMTDCSTPEDGLACQKLGAEIIGTTLSGYTTPETPEEPDLALVKTLSDAGCRVIAEGRYNTPAQAEDAMRHGAWAVTVGSAITRLEHICQWYNTAMKKAVL
ncbi:N-acetylmannosamine-6-phosphate 2-epimerase, partial [Bacillus amyloliquefaciens]|nr:N-acetylmannosamine-6-phosphate 2-epimerase [Bacillus amyloliquefaciens]